MKVFDGTYRWHGIRGHEIHIDVIIVAENATIARSMLMCKYSETDPESWTIIEIDTTVAEVHYINSDEIDGH